MLEKRINEFCAVFNKMGYSVRVHPKNELISFFKEDMIEFVVLKHNGKWLLQCFDFVCEKELTLLAELVVNLNKIKK